MVAGGAEATVTPVGIGGLRGDDGALEAQRRPARRASRPFDKGRDGFVCGEGSGILVLESLSRAKKRGAKIYAEIIGYGASSDAYHLTQPAPARRGRAALDEDGAQGRAALARTQIDYINAHGTSTPVGRHRASRRPSPTVFGAHATGHRKLWVSSTKSMMGHLLGAAGAVESAVCALAIAEGKIPPTINLDDQDPKCPLDYVPNTARERRVKHALNNSFGFGGTNCLARLLPLRAELYVRWPSATA